MVAGGLALAAAAITPWRAWRAASAGSALRALAVVVAAQAGLFACQLVLVDALRGLADPAGAIALAVAAQVVLHVVLALGGAVTLAVLTIPRIPALGPRSPSVSSSNAVVPRPVDLRDGARLLPHRRGPPALLVIT
jgi:hypothetical protein